MAARFRCPGSHQAAPIEILDDDDRDERFREAELAYNNPAHRRPVLLPGNEVITIEDDEEDELDEEEERALAVEMPFVDLTDHPDDEEPQPVEEITGHTASPIVAGDEVELHELAIRNGRLRLRSGTFMELKQPIGRFRASFFKIAAIVRTQGRTVLRGYHYTRTRNLSGLLRRQVNELVLLAHVYATDGRDWNRQAMIDIDPQAVRCVRILRTTNTPYPGHNDAGQIWGRVPNEWVEDNLAMVCRWQYVLVSRGAQTARDQRECEWLLRRINRDDADAPLAVADAANLFAWRAGKIPGGSYGPDGKQITPTIDLDDDDDGNDTASATAPSPTTTAMSQRSYSGGDAFCGAGGASRGMKQAGVKLVFSIDSWAVATRSYKRNFPDVTCHEKDVFDFCTDRSGAASHHRVDVLHLSPPCQVFSPAHTSRGRDDEANEAALFACGHVVEKVRPRVFTIEQTFGLLRARFAPQFNTLLGAFTSAGYSVRWKIVHFRAWGLCQNRRRLIILGAAPGERLPDFPRNSHSDNPANSANLGGAVGSLRPFTTLRDAVGYSLVRDRNQHNLSEVEGRPKARAAYSPDARARHVITCGGGHSYHWTGKRDFTVREYANIQGFPRDHAFEGPHTACKKQIGNAVPPTMARRLYRHLLGWLRVQDGVCADRGLVARTGARVEVERIRAASCGGGGVPEVLVIDDEEDDDDDVEDGRRRPRPGATSQTAIALFDDDEPESGSDAVSETQTLGRSRSPSPLGVYRLDPNQVLDNGDDDESDSHTLVGDDGDDDVEMVVEPLRQTTTRRCGRQPSVELVCVRSLKRERNGNGARG